jgi:hypothetical protein
LERFDPRVRLWMLSLAFALMSSPVSHLVILTVDSVTLKAMDGIIYGTIHPPRPTITPAGDEYEQVFKDLRVYKISIRKFSELKV